MQVALIVSAVAHALLLIIRAADPEGRMLQQFENLSVILVNSKSSTAPKKADALAQANLDGGGNTDLQVHMGSPFPLSKNAETATLEELEKQRQALEEQQRTLMAHLSTYKTSDAAPDSANRDTQEAHEGDEGEAAHKKQLDIPELEGEIKKNISAYEQRPRKLFLGAKVKEVVYARYVEQYRQRIERIGEENYPDEAKRSKIYGSLMVTTQIRADGSIVAIDIERSSGHRVLDEAAKRLIRMAAPFQPFTPELRKAHDVIGITRTLTFTRSDQFDVQE